ncbi:MAG: YkgJ family cysteine cluster protein [Sphingobacteriia bacterium]|nr:YkgJ family cysteine cluster protein [Sphingobacteriia bacterium]
MITNLDEIAAYAALHETENQSFQLFLKTQNAERTDEFVKVLNERISPQIDCTQCGNCCKTLMINVNEEEANALAGYLHLQRSDFDERFIEKGMHGMMLINQIPCHFFKEKKCSVYDYRFAGCREFPGLHLPHFIQRLFTVFMHYNRCPIIFNVIEELKYSMEFKK